MNELDAYIQFRKEIDTLFYPMYRESDYVEVTTRKDEDGNVIALLIVEADYIDCLWVAEEHRGKGIGYELVVQHCLEHSMPTCLRILHNNKKANRFWRKVFSLYVLESNEYDNLYRINGFNGRTKE